MKTAPASAPSAGTAAHVSDNAAADPLRAIEAHYEESAFVARAYLIAGPGAAADGLPRHLWVCPDTDALNARRTVNVRDLLRFEIETLSVTLPGRDRVSGVDVSFAPLLATTHAARRDEAQRQFEQRRARAAMGGGTPAGPLPQGHGTLGDDRCAASAAAAIASRRPRFAVDASTHLDLDLEFESIERVETLLEAARLAGVELPRERTWEIVTAGDLVDALRRAPQREPDDGASGDPWPSLLQQCPADGKHVASLARPQWLQASLAYLALRVGRLAFKPCFRVRVSGREHLPLEGPYLLTANHQSYIDGFLICSVLPWRAMRAIFILGAPEYFATPLLARLASTFSLVPVDPDSNLVGAMQTAATGLRHGRVLLIFPEGERSIGGALVAFRPGTALLASRLGVPIVPVAIDGAHEVWPRGLGLAWERLRPGRRPCVQIRFGAAIRPGAAETDTRLNERLRDSVATMLADLRR